MLQAESLVLQNAQLQDLLEGCRRELADVYTQVCWLAPLSLQPCSITAGAASSCGQALNPAWHTRPVCKLMPHAADWSRWSAHVLFLWHAQTRRDKGMYIGSECLSPLCQTQNVPEDTCLLHGLTSKKGFVCESIVLCTR